MIDVKTNPEEIFDFFLVSSQDSIFWIMWQEKKITIKKKKLNSQNYDN